MAKTWKLTMTVAFILSIMLALSACTNRDPQAAEQNQSNDAHTENTQNVADNPPANNRNLDNPLIIPSESGDKTETTNEHGTRYKGMGNNIYSTIGTSGIHEGGVSSYFESILKGEGITGVKVFVVDDSMILARNNPQTTSHEYDNMQRDLLSGTEGMAGKGEMKGVKGSQSKNDDDTFDNLSQAKAMINDMFGGNVKILTVTDPDATDLIDRIKEDIMNASYQTASDDLYKLLQMSE